MTVYKAKTPTKDGREYYFRIKFLVDFLKVVGNICKLYKKSWEIFVNYTKSRGKYLHFYFQASV